MIGEAGAASIYEKCIGGFGLIQKCNKMNELDDLAEGTAMPFEQRVQGKKHPSEK